MNKEYKPITNLWKDSEGYRYFGTLKLSSKIKYDGDDFIPLWEWINQLQQENKKQKEVIDKIIEIINYYGVDKEYNDNVILRHILKDMLDILKEVSE